jgi:hypothetical protein
MGPRRARWAVWVLAGALGSCADLSFFEAISPAPPGTLGSGCASQSPVTVTSLELGEDEQSPTGLDRPFVPLADGERVRVVRGLQGADMVVLALRVRGLGATPCVPQRTDVLGMDGQRISFNARNVAFEAAVDGTALARRMFFPGDYREGPAVIRVTLGGMTILRAVQIVRTP